LVEWKWIRIFQDGAPKVSGLINGLVDKGFVETTPNERDNRSKELRLTEEGLRVYECLARGLENAPRSMPIDEPAPSI